jgi:hypothetical protein
LCRKPSARFGALSVTEPPVAIGVELLDHRPLLAIWRTEAEAALSADVFTAESGSHRSYTHRGPQEPAS